MKWAHFKAITFDCYGTLIDWERGIATLAMPWAQAKSPDLEPNRLLETFAVAQKYHQSVTPVLLYTEVLRRAYGDVEQEFGLLPNGLASNAEEFSRRVGDWPPFDDTIEALAALKRHYKLGVLSNVDNISLKETLNRLQVPFDVVVTAEDVSAYKPDLAHFHEAAAAFGRIGIRKDEILHVAQSRFHDIGPANRLGLTSVWVNRGHGKPGQGLGIADEQAIPTTTVTSLRQLVEAHAAAAQHS